MAKITRKNQKIFCGGTPYQNTIAQFGSLKDGSKVFTDDPDVIQSLPAFELGWGGATINNNAPALQDVNSLDYLYSRQLAYLFQQGVSEWNEDTTYWIGSLVSDGLGAIYKSVIDNNLNQAISDSTKWLLLFSRKIVDKNATYSIDNTDWMIRAVGVVGFTVTIPQATSLMTGRELCLKSLLTGGALLTINCASGSLINGYTSIILILNEGVKLVCNGSSWDVITNTVKSSNTSNLHAGTVASSCENVSAWPTTITQVTTLYSKDGYAWANGAILSQTDYSELYNRIGSTWNTAVDPLTGLAQSNPSNGFFRIPNLQGTFLRGVGNFADNTKDTTLGGFQADQIQDHVHNPTTSGKVSSSNAWFASSSGIVPNALASDGAGNNTSNPVTGNHGTETRPQNVGVYHTIKLWD